MQDYSKTNWLSLKIILFFLLVVFIAYLPVSSFLFSLKNDAFNGYFPPKFFMSEALHQGQLPIWNPYINYGYPLYGDMSAGYWSPFTWLISSTVGYNVYTYTLETLLYIFLSGIGMFILGKTISLKKNIALIAAVSYMCCGFQVGHLQHLNWLSAAAFLPFCIWAYLKMFNSFSLKNVFVAVLLFYLLLSSAHPGLIIGAFYFFIFLSVALLLKKEYRSKLTSKNFYLSYGLFLVTLILLSAAMLAGYADILPHFVRAEKLSANNIATHSTSLQSWISSLIPMGIVKNDSFYNTDLSLRDSYSGLGLLIFFILLLFNKKTQEQKFLLIAGSFFFLVSSVAVFKNIIYDWAPMFGYVRLNGEFRIFALLCFILAAALQLNKYNADKAVFKKSLQLIFIAVFSVLFLIICFSLYKTIILKEGFLFKFSEIFNQPGLAAKLKYFIDNLSFYDSLWLHGIIQLLFLCLIRKALLHKEPGYLRNLVLADMIVASLLVIPFTGAGKASAAQVQAMLNESPKGLPIPDLNYKVAANPLPITDADVLGSRSMYNKQIGTKAEVPYPIQLYNMKAFFNEENNAARTYYQEQSWLYLKNKSLGDSIFVQAYSPTKIVVKVESNTKNEIIFQQNYYPYWYYRTNNGVQKPVEKEDINFIKIPVEKGSSLITLSFEPRFIKIFMGISLATLLVLLMLIPFLHYKKPKSLSPSSQ